jgi:hypothetical protein
MFVFIILIIYNLTLYNLIFYNCSVHIPFCKSYIDYPTTVPHIGGDSMAWRLFCTTALPDDGAARPETCKSFVNQNIVCAFCWSDL